MVPADDKKKNPLREYIATKKHQNGAPTNLDERRRSTKGRQLERPRIGWENRPS